jgi:hypothetical protein
LARPTWALAAVGAVGLVDSGQAAEAGGLADSGQAAVAVGLANREVGLADFEQAGSDEDKPTLYKYFAQSFMVRSVKN